jgi:hypothetical protein
MIQKRRPHGAAHTPRRFADRERGGIGQVLSLSDAVTALAGRFYGEI